MYRWIFPAIGFVFCFNVVATAVTLTREPYLQLSRPKNMTIRWKTDVATDSRVIYSTDPNNLDKTAIDSTITTDHTVTLSGLGPNIKYFYQVGSTATILSVRYNFYTSPDDGHPLNTRIWVVGDAGAGTTANKTVRDAYLSFTGTNRTHVFFPLGDSAYETGTDSEFQTKFFDVYKQILRSTASWPTLGDRDTAGSASPPPTLPYYTIFDLPKNAEAGGVASGTEDYYSFNYGTLHVVSLDSMTSDRTTSGPMLTWLKNDLAANKRPWIIAFWHHSPYSKGNHNSDSETEMIQMRANANKILEDNGVDLIVSGHSNSYERTKFINGHYGSSGTFNNSMVIDGGSGRKDGTGEYKKPPFKKNAGAVYIVTGSSGVQGGGSLNYPAMYLSLNQLGSVVMDLSCGKLNVKFLRDTGAIGDYFTILKDNLAPGVTITSPPEGATFTAPANITVTATATDADSYIRKVRFERNGVHTGSDWDAPYSNQQNNVGPGNYQLTAYVEDDMCAFSWSIPVNITVK